MVPFLKHMGKYTHNQLRSKSFEEVQKLYEREQRWINDFVSMDDDSQQQAKIIKKRPRADPNDKSVKKQKLQDDAEKEELRACLDIVLGDEIAIADGSSKNYKIFSEMLDDFDRQDVVDLHRVHVLLMHTGIAIHMMIEKKYPLTQEMLSRMLSRRLEVDHESEMAFKLLRFTRSQLQK
ncbi:hypothetical protein Tco_1147343 [Tanacetum coccineum]